MKDQISLIFWLYLKFLTLIRYPYLWVRKRWPSYFEKRIHSSVNLDTSRMLPQTNFLHRLFFHRGFKNIRFNEAELEILKQAQNRGYTILLMRHWGQVEYNYFNYLFLKHGLPLSSHNNMVKMGHWMPWQEYWSMHLNKIDQFISKNRWPYNNKNFDLKMALEKKQTIVLCLNLPPNTTWLEPSVETQASILKEILELQANISESIQLIPLHFIYDKRPEKKQHSLIDVIFGPRSNPGYLRRMFLFLRNYRRWGAATIGQAIDVKNFIDEHENISKNLCFTLTNHLQTSFDQQASQVTGPRLKSRPRVIHELLSKFDGDPTIKKHLSNIVSDINFSCIEIWERLLTWIFSKFYGGLEIDQKGITQIKSIVQKGPIILVPCHKSHLDYMLLSYVFFQNNLSIPHICAGDNLSFWPLGWFLRKSGAYFIRRRLSGDQPYALALQAYVTKLLKEGFVQEIFIEGTRSRTGKLSFPKIGILSMIFEAYLKGKIQDVTFVPIAIDYEEVLEIPSYLQEIQGKEKKKEKISDLFKLSKLFKKRYGKIYVQFAKPLSLKKAFESHSVSSKDTDRNGDKLNKLAESMLQSINQVSTLFPNHLIATALLFPVEISLSESQIIKRVEELLQIAEFYKPRKAQSLSLFDESAIRNILEKWKIEGMIKRIEKKGESYFSVPDNFRFRLDIFKNQAIHLFTHSAFQQLAKKKAIDPCFLKSLLQKEFILLPKPDSQAPEYTPDWIGEILLPFVESYYLTLQAWENRVLKPNQKWDAVKDTLAFGHTLKAAQALKYPESLSRFTIQNAVIRFTDMGIFGKKEERKALEKNLKIILKS